MTEHLHLAPGDRETVTGCCARPWHALPARDAVTVVPELVTCTGAGY